MQGISRRAVKCGWLDHVQPMHQTRRHSRCAAAEGETLRTQPLGASERAPASHIQRENCGNADRVAWPQTHCPHDTGMRVGYRSPVTAADGERCRTAGRAACAVNMEYFVGGDAQIVTERRCSRLRVSKVFLEDDRNLVFEILERDQVCRVESRFIPSPLVKGRVFVSVAANLPQAFQDCFFPLSRGHGLAFLEPIATLQ